MDDNDTLALQIAASAVTAMDVAYRNADGFEQVQMQDARDHLFAAYSVARNRLMATGVIVTNDQLDQMRQLQADLGAAADKMAFAGAALKLAGILARIALV